MTQIALKKTRFPFVSGATHGWLLVTKTDLQDAGLKESDIAPTSKIRNDGAIIALHEDAGAQTFLRVWERALGHRVEIQDCALYPDISEWRAFGTKGRTS